MDNKTFSASTIAQWFISKDKTLKQDVMKLLKLVYIAHGFHLALTDTSLITEDVQAWKYGPVIPELYFQLKADNLITSADERERLENNDRLKDFLTIIYDKYKQFSGQELSNLTHKKGTPWDITVNKFKSKVENDLIKEHYKELLNK